MYIDAPAASAMLLDLEELVSCESPSHVPEAVARSAEVVALVGERRLNRTAELLEVSGITHVRWKLGNPRAPRILVLGHHDTVWPLGTLDTLPFSYVHGVVRGPGCFDMKAGIVQAFHALAANPADAHVTVLFTGDEEVGSATSQALIMEAAEGSTAVLIPEPSAEGGALKVARKGYGSYRLELQGRAAHAGLEPERGINATVAMAQAILDVCDLAAPSAGTTVTPTMTASGTTGNTVPDRAIFHIDVRAETADELHRVGTALADLQAHLDGARLVLHTDTTRYPMDSTSSHALFELAGQVAEELGQPSPSGAAVGGVSDGNLTAAAGIPTLDGLGPVGGGAHAESEHVQADAMPGRSLLLRGLIHRLAVTTPASSRV
jgi:glutamate carboxypeptidase